MIDQSLSDEPKQFGALKTVRQHTILTAYIKFSNLASVLLFFTLNCNTPWPYLPKGRNKTCSQEASDRELSSRNAGMRKEKGQTGKSCPCSVGIRACSGKSHQFHKAKESIMKPRVLTIVMLIIAITILLL